MKKLKLNLQHLEGVKVLTREELKKVLGGDGGSGIGIAGCATSCTCPPGYVSAKNNKSTTFDLSIICSGTCTATDGVSVSCTTSSSIPGGSGSSTTSTTTCTTAAAQGCVMQPVNG